MKVLKAIRDEILTETAVDVSAHEPFVVASWKEDYLEEFQNIILLEDLPGP